MVECGKAYSKKSGTQGTWRYALPTHMCRVSDPERMLETNNILAAQVVLLQAPATVVVDFRGSLPDVDGLSDPPPGAVTLRTKNQDTREGRCSQW